ncbi:MAG: hypothetical protein HY823_13075 [Acidobacteria bacterium]|nr:hypothetical protein [Acidobacteriota bacterium]
MASPDNPTSPTPPKVSRAPKPKLGDLPLVRALSPGRIALLQLIVRFPGVPRVKLLAIPGVGDADLAYLVANDLIKLRNPARYHATHHGEIVGKRGW